MTNGVPVHHYTKAMDSLFLELSRLFNAKIQREAELEDLLRSACAIAERKGEGTAWERFLASAAELGINGVTARTYRVLPSDEKGGDAK